VVLYTCAGIRMYINETPGALPPGNLFNASVCCTDAYNMFTNIHNINIADTAATAGIHQNKIILYTELIPNKNYLSY